MNLTRSTGIKRTLSNALWSLAMLPFIPSPLARLLAKASSRFYFTLSR